MSSRFVHLHTHSHYSLLQALPKIKELVAHAKSLGMDSLALTDYGAMYGAIEFYEACRKQGIKPVIGLCAYMALDKLTDKRPRIDNRQNRLVLLAETNQGYKNLLKLTTVAHTEGFYYKARIDKDVLREYGQGLIGLSGGLKGEICQALAMDNFEKAERVAEEYVDILGEGNFFLEMQDRPELDQWNARNEDLKKLSEKTGVPLVATKDIHYLKPEDAEAHDILLCIGEGKILQQENRLRMTDADYSFVSGEHMERAFSDCPEAIENTRRIADRCDAAIELGKWHFADISVPEGKTHEQHLRDEVYSGIEKKVPEMTDEIKERLEYELDIIGKKGYSPYFLVVSDYMRWCKEQGIVTTTRGSAAGSLVSYAIDIVPVNPLIYKLPFERFLNPFRPSPPDIDSDLEDQRRDEVIEYVTQKYGKDKVAQIGTFGTLLARGAARDVGRVLDYPYAFCDRIAKLIPMGSQGFPMSVERAINETPELKELLGTDPNVKRLLDLAQRVEGCARHVSVHAAGVVIAPKPLTEYTALQKESGGEKLITQFEMNAVENAGVLKMDFLGLKNLTILGRAVEIVKRTKGIDVDLYNIPLDDQKTFDLLGEGDTTGVFQLGGSGMTRYLKELKPSKITDIMAMVALFRPGPIESIPEFIRRKHNPELVKYMDPRLKDILHESYGILTYQDDVLLTAINLAGYDWEEADKLRKAIGKKIPEEMAKQKEKFISGCIENGMSEHKAKKLWQLIEPFAAYGFNKSHAASYGMVAYQTAYMKANYLCEFMTAVLTADAGDTDRIAVAVAECGKLGIKVLPPDINSSLLNFTYIDDRNIRFGLLAIKNLGSDIIETIIGERERGGPFKSITDFASRIDSKNFNKKSLEALVKSGALDSMGERNSLLASTDKILAHNRKASKDRNSGQKSLFHALPMLALKADVALREVPPASKREKLAWERELLGLYVSEHPFREYVEYFGESLVAIGRLGSKRGTRGLIYVGGMVMDVRKIITKNKEPMAFARLEDESGTAEVVVFPSVYRQNPELWEKDRAMVIEGRYSEKDGEVKILCEKGMEITQESVCELKKILSSSGQGALGSAGARGEGGKDGSDISLAQEYICISVPPKIPRSFVDELTRIFNENPGSRKVYLVVEDGKRPPKKIETQFRISFSGDTISAIEKLVGRGAVKV